MNEFLFIFREGDRPTVQPSQEDMQENMKKWMGWIEGMKKQEIYLGGNPLEPSGKSVKGKNKVVTDGPFAEGKELVGGYVLIKAKNMETAVEISKGCPIFESNGAVEVRPIQKMDM